MPGVRVKYCLFDMIQLTMTPEFWSAQSCMGHSYLCGNCVSIKIEIPKEETIVTMQGKAVVVWSGTLASGKGHAEFGSGAGGAIPVTCALEDKTPAGKSSPEELLAAAHASCFSMALSQMLTMGGCRKIEELRVAITTTLDQVNKDGPYLITREEVDVSGRAPGLDEAGFLKAVEAAKTMCAVGLALKGNVEIVYKTSFDTSS